MQQHVLAAENVGDAVMQPAGEDIDDQMQDLMNALFVENVKDFFQMTLQRIRHDPDKRAEFLRLCRTIDSV